MGENIANLSEALMVDASAISPFALGAHFYEKDIVCWLRLLFYSAWLPLAPPSGRMWFW